MILPADDLEPFLFPNNNEFTALETLSVVIDHIYVDERSWHSHIGTFSQTPTLLRVCFNSSHAFAQSFVSFPWKQLVHLELGEVNLLLSTPNFLHECINLKECKLEIGNWVDNQRPSNPLLTIPITLPYLVKFEVRFNKPDVSSWFLSRLSLPALKEFGLLLTDPADPWPHYTIETDIYPSTSSLHHLTIESHRISLEQLVDMLRWYSDLTYLSVKGSEVVSTKLYRVLTCMDQPDKNLVPQLKELEIGPSAHHETLLSDIVTMTESRCRSPRIRRPGPYDTVQLSTLTISLPHLEECSWLERRMQNYEMEGLNLIIK